MTIPLQILAILVDIVLFEGIALAIRTGRKQTLQELKEDTFEGLFEPEEIVEMYEKIAQPIRTIRAILKTQKKKKFQKTIFYLPEQKNECFSK